ncbi:PP2C family protein-serine/threonine phosphatase [Planctomicrobium sp. SH668]|uniref:PP2C family protein-serine/threonine phosphatase n=1 Tax=Planctomicrobium sp. SH668 TaxID=3448126 RepID=UPI003F5C91EE
MYWEQSVQCGAETDIGLRRQNNEDSHYVHVCSDESEWRRSGHLLMVADGMGGHAVGELASQIAVETVPHVFLKSTETDPCKLLREAITAANAAIYERGTQNVDFLHMGTTCSVLALTSQGAIAGHVGDSRLYRVRRDRIDQLTFDHSLEWELERQHGHLDGFINAHQHRNVITRSLGPEKSVDVDIEGPFPVYPEDTYLLCSDGVSNQISDPELGAILRELPPHQASKLLINLANSRGGPDNSTVVIARVGALPANVVPISPERAFENPLALGWSWLIGYWLTALGGVTGIGMSWMGHDVQGAFLIMVSLIALAGLSIALVRRQKKIRSQMLLDASFTHHSRPHRTAVGLSSKALLELLLKTSGDLQRAAQEDRWGVNWEEYQQTLDLSLKSQREKRYSKGIREIARAISIIMDKLPRNGTIGREKSHPSL